MAHFPIPPELQPGFAIYCASALFLGASTFVILCLMTFVIDRRRERGGVYLIDWAKELWGLFLKEFQKIEEASATHTANYSGRIDWLPVVVVSTACVSLATIEYYGGSGGYYHFETFLRSIGVHDEVFFSLFNDGARGRLFRLGYWSSFIGLFYFIVPVILLKLFFRVKIRDFGLSLDGLLEHSWIYVLLFLIVFPFVVAVSTTASFRSTYPFYPSAYQSPADFFVWEAIYAFQFLTLEFFFRGLLIHGLKRRFGFYAILLSVIPYCMIHFGKPFPETIGAIIAGIALGILSLFSNSIWLGVLIHISVAISMDFLSLAGQGKF